MNLFKGKTCCLIIVALLHVLACKLCYAQSIRCPESKAGFTFSGPNLKTDIYGRTKAFCRYYDRRHLKATLEVHFFQDYNKQKDCNARIFRDADVRSWEYQAYGYLADENKLDEYNIKFWLPLLDEFVRQSERLALPCKTDRRMYRRPVDIRKNK